MKKIPTSLLFLFVCFICNAQIKGEPVRTIFASGGNYGAPFIRYVIALTKKSNPRICFLPSATGGETAEHEIVRSGPKRQATEQRQCTQSNEAAEGSAVKLVCYCRSWANGIHQIERARSRRRCEESPTHSGRYNDIRKCRGLGPRDSISRINVCGLERPGHRNDCASLNVLRSATNQQERKQA